MIRFNLELLVRLNHPGIAVSASRLHIPFAYCHGSRRLSPKGCVNLNFVRHLRFPVPAHECNDFAVSRSIERATSGV
jgi:hypothetical protein